MATIIIPKGEGNEKDLILIQFSKNMTFDKESNESASGAGTKATAGGSGRIRLLPQQKFAEDSSAVLIRTLS